MLTILVVSLAVLSFIAWIVWELRHAVKADDDDIDF